MGTLFSIGELLIDFIPIQKGRELKDVAAFERAPGGAPANVAAAAAKWGGRSSMITKLGEDAFGDFLLETLKEAGVETEYIKRTHEANTGLAFVSLREDGERDFSFYRKPSADLLLNKDEISGIVYNKGDILHFCSVDLVESPMKQAHLHAIQQAKTAGSLISFDPNVRLPLWDDPEECRSAILDFIPLAHIVKISDEELEFITGLSDVEQGIASLFKGDVQAVVFTKGGSGADLYLKNNKFTSAGFAVDVMDTTGAGDAFIAGLLYKLLEQKAECGNLGQIFVDHYKEILDFSNAAGALTTAGKGAISALPDKANIEKLIRQRAY
ncbi:carbohydrate kinase [Bacillus sp. MUM 13]|uniref:carbohydrate kinase family protein n=1 Tax=Bacillus sp. MUM 13 TaxID=1678001 RepID=UPI0008F579ED|nr:carbohydrate kinase [Bacillus sp. MUM 13]OIK14714.1 carbohydrate kinase [Bacillus sp. MUM 13]